MSHSIWRFAAAAAVLVVAFPVLAQQGLPPPGPPPAGYNGQPSTPADQSDRLRQGLNLRPDQETALQAFVASMQPNVREMDEIRAQSERDAALPTPQRLDGMVARMDRMRTMAMARIATVRAFYAQLTPAQQHAFDAMPPMH